MIRTEITIYLLLLTTILSRTCMLSTLNAGDNSSYNRTCLSKIGAGRVKPIISCVYSELDTVVSAWPQGSITALTCTFTFTDTKQTYNQYILLTVVVNISLTMVIQNILRHSYNDSTLQTCQERTKQLQSVKIFCIKNTGGIPSSQQLSLPMTAMSKWRCRVIHLELNS